MWILWKIFWKCETFKSDFIQWQQNFVQKLEFCFFWLAIKLIPSTDLRLEFCHQQVSSFVEEISVSAAAASSCAPASTSHASLSSRSFSASPSLAHLAQITDLTFIWSDLKECFKNLRAAYCLLGGRVLWPLQLVSLGWKAQPWPLGMSNLQFG